MLEGRWIDQRAVLVFSGLLMLVAGCSSKLKLKLGAKYPVEPSASMSGLRLDLAGRPNQGKPLYVNKRDLSLNFNLSGEDACRSIASLLITEGDEERPRSEAPNAVPCSVAVSTDITFHLVKPGDGEHTLRAWGFDMKGIASSKPAVLNLILDTVPPGDFQILSPTQSAITPVTVAWTPASGASGYRGVVAADAACTDILETFSTMSETSSQLKLISEGVYGLCITAYDEAGNSTHLSAPLTIDLPSPAISFKTPLPSARGETAAHFPVSGSCSEDSLSITVTATDTHKSVVAAHATCGGTARHSWSATLPLTALADGTLTLEAKYDGAKALESKSARVTVIKDTVVPTVAIDALGSPYMSQAAAVSYALAGDCSEDGQPVSISVDATSGSHATANATCGQATTLRWSVSVDATSLMDGALSITADHADSAGNAANQASKNVTKDTVAPSLTATAMPAAIGPLSQSSATLTLAGETDDTTSGVTDVNLSLSDGTSCYDPGVTSFSASCPNWIAAAGTEAWSIGVADSAFSNGTSYTLSAISSDDAGNAGASTSLLAFTWDSTSPSLVALSINEGASTSTNHIRVDLTASDDSNVTHFCLKFNSTTAPTTNDPCWVPVNAPVPGLTPAPSLSISGFPMTIGVTSGTYSVYGWAKDTAQNSSSLSAAASGTLGIDKAQTAYTAPSPPALTDLVVASSDAPSDPVSTADLTIAAGADVYVKWNASSSEPLTMSVYYTIDDVSYTLVADALSNGTNGSCTPDSASTSADDGNTGCYFWSGGPNVASFVRVRVVATDARGMTTFAAATPLNVPYMSFVAGNTEPGIGASATSAVFFNDLSLSASADTGSFVITSNGTVIFRDPNRGLITVSPTDGVARLLIPTTGVTAGDGGPVSGAQLKRPSRIALDYQDGVLVFDDDRIRRIDTSASPMTIDTIIGGGTSTVDGVGPLSVQISPPGQLFYNPSPRRMVLFAMPDGKIFFQADHFAGEPIADGARVRVYDPSTGLVTSHYPSGIGDSLDTTQDLVNCYPVTTLLAFDPAASKISYAGMISLHASGSECDGGSLIGAAQLDPSSFQARTPYPPIDFIADTWVAGMNGIIYFVDRYKAKISRFDPETNTTVALVGSGLSGSCDDGTPALSCAIDPQDVFVAATGALYFMDKGRLRTLDESGNVVTIMGQAFSYGDGGKPTSARFNMINSLAVRDNGTIIVLDGQERRFREFSPGGTIDSIAGNGRNDLPDTSNPAAGQPILTASAGAFWDDFVIDPTDGRVYFNRGPSKIAYLDRGTGQWIDLVYGSATPYYDPGADGALGSDISIPYYPARVLGFDGTRVLALLIRYTTSISDVMLKAYDLSTTKQSHFLGTTGLSSAQFCAEGTVAASCSLVQAYDSIYRPFVYDSAHSRWLFLDVSTATIRMFEPGGTVDELIALPRFATSFAYKAATNTIYFCGSGGGKMSLYRYEIDTMTETEMSWPNSAIWCSGRSMYFTSSGNLVFPYQQNSLNGVAEYISP